jgi:hypothetical protein
MSTKGTCITPGYALLNAFDDLRIVKLYEEHGIILDKTANKRLRLGDKIQLKSNYYIFPICSIYDTLYRLDGENEMDECPVLCRGKS